MSLCYSTCCVTCSVTCFVTSLVTCSGIGLHSFGFGVGNNGFGLRFPFSGFGVVNNGFGLHFFLALGLSTMVLALTSFFPLPPNSCVFIFLGSPIPRYTFFDFVDFHIPLPPEVDSYSFVYKTSSTFR